MHGLGQPCTLAAALFPPRLLRLVARSCALRQAGGRSSLRAAAWLFDGSPGQPSRPKEKNPPWLLLLPLRLPAMERAAACRLRPDDALRATGAHLPGGGRKGSLGGHKDLSTSPENAVPDPSKEDGQKPNKSQQLKKVFKEYGAVGVGFHVGISLMSLGMFYLAVSSGVDMTALLFNLGFDEALVQSKLAAGTSTFVLAYAIHKLFAPVRISITLVSVPFLVRYFRKTGLFKPPAPNP
ncbi:protein FAM210B, mitochondrial [Paroedura picta]|uniref:protein FAM210B, mitochondrial n=1 Tax=Paroedura picta TaxID=143630 RepID=UPI0040569195